VAAAKYDLLIEQGATLRRVIVYRDPNGAPIDLTGSRVLWQVRDHPESATTILSFDSDNLLTGQTCGPLDATGTIDFAVSDEVTATLDFTLARWDLIVESAGGERDRLLEGKATLDRGVTR
jgi:hypothetical protein